MSRRVESELIPCSSLSIKTCWHTDYDGNEWLGGNITVYGEAKQVASFYIDRSDRRENAEQLVFMVAQAISANQWLILGEPLSLADFDDAQNGFIGRLRLKPKREDASW